MGKSMLTQAAETRSFRQPGAVLQHLHFTIYSTKTSTSPSSSMEGNSYSHIKPAESIPMDSILGKISSFAK